MKRRIIYYFGDNRQDYRSLMTTGADIDSGEVRISQSKCVVVEQTHSAKIHICDETDRGSGIGNKPKIPVCDGMITNTPEVYLLIRTADCFPVLFYDPVEFVVGAVHSGREGTRKNICGNAVKEMIDRWNCAPINIRVLIGAGICAEHYEVSEDVYNAFIMSIHSQDIDSANCINKRIDIQDIIHQQIRKCGIPSINISLNNICTWESKRYFSYRRDGSTNRQINIIGIQNG